MPVVLITGASSGIGAALARNLSKRDGFQLILVARRKELLDALVQELGPDKTFAFVADVTKREEVRAAIEAGVATFGGIDVLVNNAGQAAKAAPSQITDDIIDEQMRVNVKSALYGFQEVLPHFYAKGSGHIVTTSSMLGRLPVMAPGVEELAAYTAAKHYLNALVATFRAELAPKNITVSLYSPGVVATDFGKHVGHDHHAVSYAQNVDEVAEVCAQQCIIDKKADVCSREMYRDIVHGYYNAI